MKAAQQVQQQPHPPQHPPEVFLDERWDRFIDVSLRRVVRRAR